MGGGLSSARITSVNATTPIKVNTLTKKTGIVYDICLDESSEIAKQSKAGSAYIGAIRFRDKSSTSSDASKLAIAHPSDKNFINIPLKNEIVEIHEIGTGEYTYSRIGTESNPSISANSNLISILFPETVQNENKLGDYKKRQSTNIPKSNEDNSSKYFGFGKYYNPQENLHKLKLYEGDSLIQSRFGQSIRFSAFNNSKNKFAPTLIIRNGEAGDNRKKDQNINIEEDINKDGTVIALTSGEHQLGFIPGTVDDKGKGDFKTKPESFEDYPTKLIGDQLLLNSGRIILSAKSGEMIFYSKKNYGFISDGSMSIDNQGGIDISVGDNINIITNDRDINFVTGNGTMFFGSQDLEPMVKGQQLVDILSELIDAIGAMQFLTPSGPSALGPVNSPDFGMIKSKLNNLLSQRTQLS
jgi:hypothetical protein